MHGDEIFQNSNLNHEIYGLFRFDYAGHTAEHSMYLPHNYATKLMVYWINGLMYLIDGLMYWIPQNSNLNPNPDSDFNPNTYLNPNQGQP